MRTPNLHKFWICSDPILQKHSEKSKKMCKGPIARQEWKKNFKFLVDFFKNVTCEMWKKSLSWPGKTTSWFYFAAHKIVVLQVTWDFITFKQKHLNIVGVSPLTKIIDVWWLCLTYIVVREFKKWKQIKVDGRHPRTQ